ncbi:hypothetical protein BEL04_22410 [Mucilaginibacter sp. PPCGB 2223]|uniref:ribosomal maturation YjgA family protein n=1 Tax=Mucilaginibacter sp. PPCGB 2223 TaxID=1886027 RepID=UPI000826D5AF|nr:DUF2809 domain-containing protein [Mucilaginibacter sp. PPCGB 2223]OCX50533.1 hypothetical protein BEL04_22410 [Mucilaginibacter sp. PPCGB 2223]
MLKFNLKYFTLALLLFITEVLIARYMHDALIRPYGGDVLVGILVYCFIKSFMNTPVKPTILAVLLFCYTIEILQYFHYVELLGLQNSKLARTVLGVGFSWIDMLCYTLGMLIVLSLESIKASEKEAPWNTL